MRCYICDKELSDKEVIYNEDYHKHEPCTTCLDIALDAAYSSGFKTDDDILIPYDDDLGYGDSSDVLYTLDEGELE